MAEITSRRRGELVRGVFKILSAHPEGLPAKVVLQKLEEIVPPNEFENSTYPLRPDVRRYENKTFGWPRWVRPGCATVGRRYTMATGRDTQVTKQVGEYLVAAEICRRGFLAATFAGNVPHFDIIASDGRGRHQAVEVKTIRGGSWQFDCRKFAQIRLKGNKQIIGRPVPVPYPDLVCALVRLRWPGTDEFYILTWEQLQEVVISHHRSYLESCGGVRPRKPESFHVGIRPEMLREYRDNWALLEQRLRPKR